MFEADFKRCIQPAKSCSLCQSPKYSTSDNTDTGVSLPAELVIQIS